MTLDQMNATPPVKRCQRCADDAGKTVGFDSVIAIAGVEIVPEADCQQWAHKQLIRVADKFGFEAGAFWAAWDYPNEPRAKEELESRARWRKRMTEMTDEEVNA